MSEPTSFEPDARYQEPTVQEKLADAQLDLKIDEKVKAQVEKPTEKALRLRCIELAVSNTNVVGTPNDRITVAQAYYDFIVGVDKPAK